MSHVNDIKHFVVKHGLDSLEMLPNFIWRTDIAEDELPHRFNQVKTGDLWISFAFTSSDRREHALSLVTGFYKCIHEASYRRVPDNVPLEDGWVKQGYAWMIEGKPWGAQPRHPVSVLPINDILSPKRVWNNQAIIPVTGEDFETIREHVFQSAALAVPPLEQ